MTAPVSRSVPRDPQSDVWDVVVIGTGAGGATAGFSLARGGRSVLFLERGRRFDEDASVRKGEAFVWNGRIETALSHGWWPRQLYRSNGAGEVAAPTLAGCGTGGSTALYGMLMDRFRPEDFTPGPFVPSGCGASVPDCWPITYEMLEPFYEEAERLYRVRGTADPLSASAASSLLAPPDPSEKERVLFDELRDTGLHPYRMHYACERLADCGGCYAMLCPRECRNDAKRICLRPALDRYGAQIVPECRVVRLEEEGAAVQRAICDWNGREIAVRGRVFVLAANAFFTPALLQRSANERFPDGLANSSGLVGRNLMLHVSDLFALRLKRAPAGLDGQMHHGVSLSDFCVRNATKMGTIHAHSYAAAVAASRGAHTHATSTAFVTIVEDLPYVENRVMAKPGTDEDVAYEYHYPNELRERNRGMVQSLKAAVSPRFDVQMLQPMGQLNNTHVCGTCRFGDDPARSVLDRDNRAHDLDNLYVVDASFFPSSGGISPSLTIAANSLRVSQAIDRRL